MRDFNEFSKNSNSKMINHGKLIFEKQLNGVEGCDIEVNGVSTRGIIYNHLNDMGEKECRALNFPLDISIGSGDYIKYEGKSWMVVTDIDNHYSYKNCKIQKCNQILTIDKDNALPCITSNDSYGSKANLSSDLVSSVDSKLKVEVQYNDISKHIELDRRFIFNNSKYDIYKVIDIITNIKEDVMVIVLKKDPYMPEYDDLENNLAYNGTTEEPSPADYTLEGEDEIKINQVYQYKLFPSIGNTMWKLDDYTVMNNLAELSLVDAYTVEIKGVKQGEFIELICEIGGVILRKEIIIVR